VIDCLRIAHAALTAEEMMGRLERF
jgi:hypothetical protein